MSVYLEFIDFIVPIETIKKKYPGGWEQCLKDHDYSIGRCIWYDDHLFRTGAMGPEDIRLLVEEWQKLGFTTHTADENGNPTEWIDVCVAESLFGGATLPCKWLGFDAENSVAYKAGTEPGKAIGRADFKPTDKIPDWVFQ